MPSKEHESSSVLSTRLPDELIQRLDRYLDWSATHRRVKSSRNAAIRDALSMWLDDQEQHAGLSTSQTLHRQFRTAYHSVRQRPNGVRIHQMRTALGWPRERCDAVLEELRAEEQVELQRGTPSPMSAQPIRDSYSVYGQLYLTLRWRGGLGLDRSPNEPPLMPTRSRPVRPLSLRRFPRQGPRGSPKRRGVTSSPACHRFRCDQ